MRAAASCHHGNPIPTSGVAIERAHWELSKWRRHWLPRREGCAAERRTATSNGSQRIAGALPESGLLPWPGASVRSHTAKLSFAVGAVEGEPLPCRREARRPTGCRLLVPPAGRAGVERPLPGTPVQHRMRLLGVGTASSSRSAPRTPNSMPQSLKPRQQARGPVGQHAAVPEGLPAILSVVREIWRCKCSAPAETDDS